MAKDLSFSSPIGLRGISFSPQPWADGEPEYSKAGVKKMQTPPATPRASPVKAPTTPTPTPFALPQSCTPSRKEYRNAAKSGSARAQPHTASLSNAPSRSSYLAVAARVP
ncbi:hypothetical protein B0H14DRAFT_3467162 [Mycena olivaceomarginata]|nr:hypothetical protein B0H14DRAFT_3467162 [Mycena olivaceomarginata]